MEYTQEHLAAVREAIATGERTVQFDDRITTYRSIDELLQAEERIASALKTTSTSRPKQFLGVACKGF